MAPNFDCEHCFCEPNNPRKSITNYINRIKDEYPGVYEKFTNRLCEFTTQKDGKYPYELLLKREQKDSRYLKTFVRDFGMRVQNLASKILDNNMTK